MHKIGVPRGGEADRLWKHSRDGPLARLVQTLVPPVVGRNIESRIAGAAFIIWDIFSSRVIFETRSATRFSIGSDASL